MPTFVEPADPILKQAAMEVPINQIRSPKIQSIIDRMLEIALGERTDTEKRTMVGLAAPQVGYNLRIIIVDVGVKSDRKVLGDLQAYINPQIVWKSLEHVKDREGCYSVDPRIQGVVYRSRDIKIVAYDRNSNLITEDFSGFTARIFQHEIDHLDGILFPDRVGEAGCLHWVEIAKFPEYRKSWQSWPIRCNWKTWEDLKEGRSLSWK